MDFEGGAYSYLPLRISKDLLAGNEEGLKEFQEQLEISIVSMHRLKPRGTFHPMEFLITLPDDPEQENSENNDPGKDLSGNRNLEKK